jgi:hypothetical protein
MRSSAADPRKALHDIEEFPGRERLRVMPPSCEDTKDARRARKKKRA